MAQANSLRRFREWMLSACGGNPRCRRVLAYMAVGVGCLVLSGKCLVFAADPPAAPVAASEQELQRCLQLLSDQVVAAAVCYPQQFLRNPTVQALPVELTVLNWQNRTGIDPQTISFVIPFVELADDVASYAILIHLTAPIDWRVLPAPLLARTTYGTLHGRPYRRGIRASDFSVMMLDVHTLVIAPDATMLRMTQLSDRGPTMSRVAERLRAGTGKQLDLHLIAELQQCRTWIEQYLQRQGAGSAACLAGRALSAATEHVEVRVRCQDQLAVGVILEAAPGTDGAQLLPLLTSWVQELDPESSAATADPPVVTADAPLELTPMVVAGKYVRRALHQTLRNAKSQPVENRLQVGLRGAPATQVAVCAATLIFVESVWDICCQALASGETEQTSPAAGHEAMAPATIDERIDLTVPWQEDGFAQLPSRPITDR